MCRITVEEVIHSNLLYCGFLLKKCVWKQIKTFITKTQMLFPTKLCSRQIWKKKNPDKFRHILEVTISICLKNANVFLISFVKFLYFFWKYLNISNVYFRKRNLCHRILWNTLCNHKKIWVLKWGKTWKSRQLFRLKRKVTDDLEEKKDLGTKGTKICLTFFCKLQF